MNGRYVKVYILKLRGTPAVLQLSRGIPVCRGIQFGKPWSTVHEYIQISHISCCVNQLR